MRLPLFLFLLILTGCQQIFTENASPVRTAAALIFENGLSYDGCIERIQLLSDSLLYVPTAATLPLVQKALASLPRSSNDFSRAVTIRFIETGRQGTLTCGWGSKREVGELEILEIARR